MLRNFVLKAGVEQSIGGVVRFVNLLASSEGYVTVRAKNKQGGIDLLSKLMNGDSFEFEEEITEVTIVTPNDAFVSIYVSHVKLVNNGVTVKAAGLVKTSAKVVAGVTKLNSVTAQNQLIKMRSNKEVHIGGPEMLAGAKGWKVDADQLFEIETSGDVYANKSGLVFDIGTPAQSYTQFLTGNAADGGGIIIGESESLYVRKKPPYQTVLVKNGVQLNSFQIKAAFTGFSPVQIGNAVITFAAGYFYIYSEAQESGTLDIYAGISKTKDFENYEPVRLINLRPQGITQLTAAGSPTALHTDGKNFVIQRSDASGSQSFYVKENGDIAKNVGLVASSAAFVDDEGVTLNPSSTLIARYGADMLQVSSKTIPTSQARIFTDSGEIFALNGPAVTRYDKAGNQIATYTLPSVGTGSNNLIACGADFMLCISATVANKLNIKTGAIESVTLGVARPASGSIVNGAILKTAVGHAAFEMRDGAGVTGIYKTELVTISGSIDSAEVDIMELF